MASRNQLLGQMQKPKTTEEKLSELNSLKRGRPHLSTKQKIRLDELQAWHAEYIKEQEPKFRSWVFHPTEGEKVVEGKDVFDRHIEDGWYATRAELKEAVENSRTAEGRQKEIEREFEEEIVEEKEIDRGEYLLFLRRSLEKESGAKMLYYYTMDELIEACRKLDLEFNRDILKLGNKSRIELYKHLKNYIELNT